MVYIGSHDGKLHAFDVVTGQVRWTAPTGDSISSSPAVANGMVYVGSYDKKLYAFRCEALL
jgi:outer membrane protein assembly factor BamB